MKMNLKQIAGLVGIFMGGIGVGSAVKALSDKAREKKILDGDFVVVDDEGDSEEESSAE